MTNAVERHGVPWLAGLLATGLTLATFHAISLAVLLSVLPRGFHPHTAISQLGLQGHSQFAVLFNFAVLPAGGIAVSLLGVGLALRLGRSQFSLFGGFFFFAAGVLMVATGLIPMPAPEHFLLASASYFACGAALLTISPLIGAGPMGWASTLLTASLGIVCIAAPVVMLTSPQWPGHFQKVVHAAVLLWLSLLAAGFAIREVGLTRRCNGPADAGR